MPGLTNARCSLCGRPLHRAWIPNRGNVMAHGHGESKLCAQRYAMGQDMPTQEWLRKETANRGAHNAHVIAGIQELIRLRRHT